MKSKNFGVGSPLTGVILCWQECDEEVAVAGAEDACRVAAEVIPCHVYHQYHLYQRHQYRG